MLFKNCLKTVKVYHNLATVPKGPVYVLENIV